MAAKGRSSPRIVCCAIPIQKATGKIMLVTSRKREDLWVLPKGGWEASDGGLEAAAQREALEEAGVRGRITNYVTTVYSEATTYHFYELDVDSVDNVWLECRERKREWVAYSEALRRISWKPELAEGLAKCSIAR